MRPDRPHSPAADRNRGPILDVLRHALPERARVLEIGAGTGQHAAYFTARQPGWSWTPTTVPAELATLVAGLEGLERPGLGQAAPLDVRTETDWPEPGYDAVFAANVVHIAPEPAVRALISGAARVLVPGGRLVLYGPFMRDGRHTSESNRRFDVDLRSRGVGSALRDVNDVDRWSAESGLRRVADIAMPANNFILIYD
ncbi:DUF938 domain-containing protein [Halomonas denitrificans]|nr:DUF938 domain-containing protein [Halomonas denitrificans]